MQPLIYKTTLEMERSPSWLTPETAIDLETCPDGAVAVFARQPPLWPFRGERRVRIGTWRAEAADFMSPLLDAGGRIRVRIVTLVPTHITTDGFARVAISVWGDAPASLTGPEGF